MSSSACLSCKLKLAMHRIQVWYVRPFSFLTGRVGAVLDLLFNVALGLVLFFLAYAAINIAISEIARTHG
jgi:hypothetical protein